MIKNNSIKRTASLVLASLLAASSLFTLASCDLLKKNAKEPLKEKRTNVYSGEAVSLPENVNEIRKLEYLNDSLYAIYNKIYTVTYNELGEEQSRVPGYDWKDNLTEGWYTSYSNETYIAVVPLSGGEAHEVKLNQPEDRYYNTLEFDSNGNVCGTYNEWSYDEATGESSSKFYLITADSNTGDVAEPIPLDKALTDAGCDANNTYINNFIPKNDGNMCLVVDGGIITVDKNGALVDKGSKDFADGWINSIYVDGNKQYILYYPNNGSGQFFVIENDQKTEIKTDNFEAVLNNNYGIIDIIGSKLYYSISSGICVYDFETDTTTELLNYINSDIDRTGGNSGTLILPDGRIIISQTDWSMESPESTVTVYTKIPDEQLSEEIIIRLGCLYDNYYLTKSIIGFNKKNTGVRISVKSYEQYNNEENEWKGAAKQLNNDIVTGDIPDIILLNSSLPIESYFKKGVFKDLNEFIDDPELGINRADYLENIFKANETDGKLYSMIASFQLNTLAAKSKFVGTKEGWTLDEMMAAINKLPAETVPFLEYNRESILGNFFMYSMDTFVNWETGETYFNTPAFMEFIKFLSNCSENGFWDTPTMDGGEYVYDEEAEKEKSEKYSLRFYKDYSAFDMCYISSFLDIFYELKNFVFDDVTFVGYPTTEEGSNGAVIVPDTELAISSKTLAGKEAWSFIKFLLTDEVFSNNTWQFTPSYNKLNSMVESTINEAEETNQYVPSEDDLQWYKEYYSEEYYEYMKASQKPFDESTIDIMWKLLKGATKIQRTDDDLLNIVKEELSAFFAGTKSAEDTARVIDSRVKIYVSTNS